MLYYSINLLRKRIKNTKKIMKNMIYYIDRYTIKGVK